MASKVVTEQCVETTNGIVNGHMHYARHAGGRFAGRPRLARSLGPSYAVQIGCLFGSMVSANMVLNTRKLPLRRGLASYDSPLQAKVTCLGRPALVLLQFALILWRIYWTPTPLPASSAPFLFSEDRALRHVHKLAGEIGERQVRAQGCHIIIA